MGLDEADEARLADFSLDGAVTFVPLFSGCNNGKLAIGFSADRPMGKSFQQVNSGFDSLTMEPFLLARLLLVRSGMRGLADSAAVLKDISATGAYFYSLMPLIQGEVIELFVTLFNVEGTPSVSFTGTVARVGRSVTAKGRGIAVSFSNCRELDGNGSVC